METNRSKERLTDTKRHRDRETETNAYRDSKTNRNGKMTWERDRQTDQRCQPETHRTDKQMIDRQPGRDRQTDQQCQPDTQDRQTDDGQTTRERTYRQTNSVNQRHTRQTDDGQKPGRDRQKERLYLPETKKYSAQNWLVA